MIKKLNFQSKKRNLKIKVGIILLALLLILLGAYYTLYKINEFFNSHYLKFNKIIEIKINTPIEIKRREARKNTIKDKQETAQIQEFFKKEYKDTTQEKNSPLQAIYEHFGKNKTAVAIAKAESGLNCEAISKTNDYGLFQIHLPLHQWRFDKFGGNWKNCEHNARVAREIYNERGWEAWSVFLNRKYIKFL